MKTFLKGFTLGAIILFFALINNNTHKSSANISDFEEGDSFNSSAVSSSEELSAKSSILQKTETPDIDAAAFGVYSLSTGEKLIGFEENKRWPIASITKLMTAVVARNVTLPGDRITVTAESLNVGGFAGSFSVGEIFSSRDLERALLLASSNVAAEILANFYGREKFIDAMGSYAHKLGMLNTRFADPSGLSYKNQSTVEDLAKLTQHILNNYPDIFTVTKLTKAKITNLKSGKSREILNINPFAGRSDFLGGKTGTTPEAVGNLVSVFAGDAYRPARAIILLGTNNRFEETENLLKLWK